MNDNERQAAERREQIEEKAIEWFVKMRGEDADSLRDAFEDWLGQASEHRRAYEWVEEHFGQAERLKDSGRLNPWGLSRSRTWLVASAAVAAAIALIVVLRPSREVISTGAGPHIAHTDNPLKTGHGEIRTYNLSDGSKVTLDGDSRVEVAMGKAERRLRLRQGKARFAVATDPRPFVVEAGSGRIEAQQAVFDVDYGDHEQVFVNLLSGKADIRSMAQPAVYTVPVRPLLTGQPVRYRLGAFRPEPVIDTGADRRDWPEGWVEYRSVPLDVLIADANRYSDRPIIFDDAATGDLRASGRFKLTDTATFVSRIAEVFDLKIAHKPDGIHLRTR
ncbi:FecR domain-containing protein [Sphingobium sp. Sx8-8]|uniref:FecR family protein n=1 Tax=Sphingobium sp. Sx8-8 TaxID=2933617 RepID=UPI001F573A98|nr:FecR domain-containing protein [Sphingobium sp. Sx8-8]